MAKGKRRQKVLAEKQSRKETEMKNSSGTSNYARKAVCLKKNGGMGMEYLEPKPWK